MLDNKPSLKEFKESIKIVVTKIETKTINDSQAQYQKISCS